MAFGWVYLCLSVALGGCSAQLSTSSDGLAGSTVSALELLANSSVSALELLANSSVSALELSTTAPPAMVPESSALTTSNATAATQGQNTEAPFVDDISTAITERTASSAPPSEPSSTTGAKATSARRESEAPARITKKKTTKKDDPMPLDYQTLDGPFNYDYSSLRRIGLGVAFVLFLMGILVIASSRVSRIPKCRTSSGKTYEVTRV